MSIKTELEKEITKVFPKVQIKTYDGLILKALTVLNKSKHSTKGGDVDFQQRRTEIYETLNSVSKKHQDTSIKIIFIDEGQDMDCQSIEFFFTFYPKAKLVIVGDFCQSISKTPTNSLLHRVITNREKVYIYRHHLNPVYFERNLRNSNVVSLKTSSSICPTVFYYDETKDTFLLLCNFIKCMIHQEYHQRF